MSRTQLWFRIITWILFGCGNIGVGVLLYSYGWYGFAVFWGLTAIPWFFGAYVTFQKL